MLRCLICYALPVLLLTGCASKPPQRIVIIPHVPAELRTPCLGPKFTGITNEGLYADAVLRQAAALRCSNGKIATIDTILTQAEQQKYD